MPYGSNLRALASTLVLAALFSVSLVTNAWAIAGVDFPAEGDIDFTPAHEAIDQGNFTEAIDFLEIEILEWYPDNAEALNLKAYSLRNMGKLSEALKFYNRALEADPEHQGALEYQGELFLQMGNRAAAEANLTKLVGLCPRGCDAHEELQAAIERFKDGKVSWIKPTDKQQAGG